MSATILLAGRPFCLDAAGALIDEAAGLVVVADLHLETGSAYARRGALLPPYDTMATLARLSATLLRWRPRRVVSLGDGFHDRHGPASLSPAAFDGLRGIMAMTEWVWITGNHDPILPAMLGGAVLSELELGGLTLRHNPRIGVSGPELAGHMHPKGRIAGRRLRASRPCFVTDGQRMVLPAFGAFTGGLNACDPAMHRLFPTGFDAWLLGQSRVFRVPHAGLLPEPPMYRTAGAAN